MSDGKEANFIMRLIDLVSGPAKTISGVATTATDKLTGMAGAVGGMAGKAFAYNQLSQAVQNVGQELSAAVQPGIRFNSGLAEMESVTGIHGQQLRELGQAAREQALIFGGEGADGLTVFNNLINRLGPDIASNKVALGSMGTDVRVLAKLMNNDAAGASEALSTSLLQFGVDLKNPIESARKMTEYTNIMAAGMNAGSSDVGKVSQALEQAGSTAVKAGLDFAETNAAIQTIAKSGKMGSEAGVGLRNVLSKLGGPDLLPKEVNEKLKKLHVNMKLVSDPTKSLSVRLTELKKIQQDATLTAQLFGVENKVVADTLLDNIGYYNELLPKLNDQNAAVNAAKPIMDSYEERMSRAGARVRDWGISLFDATKEYFPFIQGSVQALDTTTRLAPAFDAAKAGALGLVGTFRKGENGAKGFGLQLVTMGWNALKAGAGLAFTGITAVGSFVAGLVSATAAQVGLNIAMLANPVGLFIVGLLAVGAAVAVVIAYWDELKGYLVDFGQLMWKLSPFRWLTELIEVVFPGFKQAVADIFGSVLDWIERMWKKVTGFFSGIKKMFGSMFSGSITIPTSPYAGLGPPPGDTKPPPPPGTTPGDLNKSKDTDIEGDKGKARVVNLRIDKIEVNNRMEGSSDRGLQEVGAAVARVIVSALRDTEIILSNG